MPDQVITCPRCGHDFPLSQAIASQVEYGLRKTLEAEYSEMLEDQLRRKEDALRKRLLLKHDGELADLRDQLKEKEDSEEALRRKLLQKHDREMADLKDQLKEKEEETAKAVEEERRLRKRQRDLEEKEKALELDLERKLDEERAKIEQDLTDRLAEQHRLKDLEKEKQLKELDEQIAVLKRKAEQGSQQRQGEALELDLECGLAAHFPFDHISPVAKGVRGADLIQEVYSRGGHPCGSIIWEVKNTKAWSDGWVTKLKDDQRAGKCDLAVIASSALPKDVSHFGLVDGIWVTDFASAMAVASILRESLAQVATARTSVIGRNEKMDLLYGYISGIEFKQRVEAVIEAFQALEDELDRERSAMEKIWARREKELRRVTASVAGMYGDMEGILGAVLPRIERLQLPEPPRDLPALQA